MWLRKLQVTGVSAVGPYEWKHDAPVTEVPDDLGRELLNLGGYDEVDPPKAPEPVKAPAAEPAKVKPAAKHSKPDDAGSLSCG